MSYITPDTDIWILRNVPLDKSYTHTYFPWIASTGQDGTRASQFTALVNYLKPTTTYRNKSYSFHLQNYSYQRRNLNKIRVKIPYDILYDCNYLIFRNHAYEDKYFYAFIDNIDYINDNTSQISYSIDVMQTWHFDYTLNQCFVEREHSSTDVRGENLLPEPVNIGEYVVGNNTRIIRDYMISQSQTGWSIVFVCGAHPATGGLTPPSGYFSNGIWNQVEYRVFNADVDPTDIGQIRQAIDDIVVWLSVFNRQNTLLNVYMCPTIFAPQDSSSPTFVDYNRATSLTHSRFYIPALDFSPNYKDLNGNTWTPHNNKLLTFPYCFFTVENQQGTVQTYKYEYFRPTAQNKFMMWCENSVDPIIKIAPQHYLFDRTNDVTDYNYDFSVDLKDFPKVGYAVNDFLAKVTQAASALAVGAGMGKNPLQGITEAGKTFVNNRIAEHTNDRIKNLAMGEYLKQEDFLSSDTKDIIIDNIRNFDTKESYNVGAIGKDMLKTVGGIVGLLSMSHIQPHVSNGSMNYTADCFDFIAKEQHVDYRYAKIIDQFFDMYGYQTNSIKIPNRKVRPHFTYTKTTNCTVDGYLPHDDAELIQSIYNNGITFWKNINEIGDYSFAANGSNIPGQG